MRTYAKCVTAMKYLWISRIDQAHERSAADADVPGTSSALAFAGSVHRLRRALPRV